MAAVNDYHFITHWRVEGDIHEVYEILSDPLSYPNWWGVDRLSAEEVEREDGGQTEKPIRMKVRGWLPYVLEWELVHTELHEPDRIVSDSTGDFVGRGIWSLRQDGPDTHVVFDWEVRTEKPFLRYFSWLLKPLFSANHHWVMEMGRKGLIKKLAELK